jgi:hypothetical protein
MRALYRWRWMLRSFVHSLTVRVFLLRRQVRRLYDSPSPYFLFFCHRIGRLMQGLLDRLWWENSGSRCRAQPQPGRRGLRPQQGPGGQSSGHNVSSQHVCRSVSCTEAGQGLGHGLRTEIISKREGMVEDTYMAHGFLIRSTYSWYPSLWDMAELNKRAVHLPSLSKLISLDHLVWVASRVSSYHASRSWHQLTIEDRLFWHLVILHSI